MARETPLSKECSFVNIGVVVGGRYEILRFLGSGGVACVYMARHIYTQEKLAVKILKPRVATLHPRLPKIFLEEARKVPDANKYKVVAVKDAGVDLPLNICYIVVELMEKSLRQLLDEGVPKHRLLKIVYQVAQTMDRIHKDLKLVHLDLKPENIFVDRHGDARVGDFGFAKYKVETFSRSDIWGTPVYTAPEVWREEFSPKSDVYSLGVILAEMLTGKPYGRNIENPFLRELVEQATRPDPRDRITMSEYIETLGRYLKRKTAVRSLSRRPIARLTTPGEAAPRASHAQLVKYKVVIRTIDQATRKPVSCQVKVWCENEEKIALSTDSRGEATVYLPQGVCRIIAVAKGRRQRAVWVNVAEEKTIVIEVPSKTITIKVRVVDRYTNNPVRHALVEALKNNRLLEHAYTDEDGIATLRVIEGTYVIRALAVDYQEYKSRKFIVIDGELITIALTPEKHILRVEVTEEITENPIRGALVELVRGGKTMAHKRTDHNGEAIFEVPGGIYLVKVTKQIRGICLKSQEVILLRNDKKITMSLKTRHNTQV